MADRPLPRAVERGPTGELAAAPNNLVGSPLSRAVEGADRRGCSVSEQHPGLLLPHGVRADRPPMPRRRRTTLWAGRLHARGSLAGGSPNVRVRSVSCLSPARAPGSARPTGPTPACPPLTVDRAPLPPVSPINAIALMASPVIPGAVRSGAIPCHTSPVAVSRSSTHRSVITQCSWTHELAQTGEGASFLRGTHPWRLLGGGGGTGDRWWGRDDMARQAVRLPP